MRPSSSRSVREKVQVFNQRNMNSYALHQISQSQSTEERLQQQHQLPSSPSWQTQFHQITPSPSPPKSHHSHLYRNHHARTPSDGSDMVTEPSVVPSTPASSSSYISEYTLRSSRSFPPEHTTTLRAPPNNLPQRELFYHAPASASAATFGFPLDRVEDSTRERSRTVSTFSGILNQQNQSHHREEEYVDANSELLNGAAGDLSNRRGSDNTMKKDKIVVNVNTALKPTISSNSSTKSSTYTLTPTSDIEFEEGEFRQVASVSHPTTTWGVPKRYIFLLVGLYLVGVLAAVGNHLLFAFLNNHAYGPLHPFGIKNMNINPVWISRISVFLPLVVVSCYNSALALCLGQTAWYTVRRPRDGISIRGIDALFSLSRDIRSPFRLMSSLRDISFFTVSASVLAVAGWFTPLVLVFVPSSLSHSDAEWKYKYPALLISYGSATLVATLALIGGLASVKANGVVQETGFAGILCATRNKELDDILRGYSMGGVGVRSGTAGKVRLLFGETERVVHTSSRDAEGIVSRGGERHVAFGLVGRVMDVERGGLYS